MKIAFTGGGTLGHIYPALSIYDYLVEKDKSLDFFWVGRDNENERTVVEENNIRFYSISCGKLRRYFSFSNLVDFFKVFVGYFQAKRILRKERPDLLFSKGGFVSVPVVYAAKRLKIKIVTHESDLSLGLATKLNSKVATYVFKGFPLTDAELNDKKYIYSGNPLRKDLEYFKKIDTKSYEEDLKKGVELKYSEDVKKTIDLINNKFDKDKKMILIVGGSLGALEINKLIEDNLDKLLIKYNIYHQMGEKTYREKEIDGYICTKYINNELGYLYKKADLIISRCGANTLNEEISFNKNILAIPLKNNISRGEQVLNANYFKALNLLEVFEKDMNFIDTVENLLNNDIIKKRFIAYKSFENINANEIIYSKINSLLVL